MAAKPHVKMVGTGFTVLPGGDFTKEVDGPADVQDWSEKEALIAAGDAMYALAMQINTSGDDQDPAHPLSARRSAIKAQLDFLLLWRIFQMVGLILAGASQAQVGDVFETPDELTGKVTQWGRRFNMGLKATCTAVLP